METKAIDLGALSPMSESTISHSPLSRTARAVNLLHLSQEDPDVPSNASNGSKSPQKPKGILAMLSPKKKNRSPRKRWLSPRSGKRKGTFPFAKDTKKKPVETRVISEEVTSEESLKEEKKSLSSSSEEKIQKIQDLQVQGRSNEMSGSRDNSPNLSFSSLDIKIEKGDFIAPQPGQLCIFHGHVSPSNSVKALSHQVITVGGGLMSDAELTNLKLTESLLSSSQVLTFPQVFIVDFIHSAIVKKLVAYNKIHVKFKVHSSTKFPGPKVPVKFHRAAEWLSRRLRRRSSYSANLSNIVVDTDPHFPTSRGIVKENVTAWLDRPYTFKKIPSYLLGGIIIRFPHRLPFKTKILMKLSSSSTVHIITERFHRNGGLPRDLKQKGWKIRSSEPIVPEQKYGKKPLVVLSKECMAGEVSLPTTVDELCVAIVVCRDGEQMLSRTERQPEVLKAAAKILKARNSGVRTLSNLLSQENSFLESLIRYALIPSRGRKGDLKRKVAWGGKSEDTEGKVEQIEGKDEEKKTEKKEEKEDKSYFYSQSMTPLWRICLDLPNISEDGIKAKVDTVVRIVEPLDTPGWVRVETVSPPIISGTIPRCALASNIRSMYQPSPGKKRPRSSSIFSRSSGYFKNVSTSSTNSTEAKKKERTTRAARVPSSRRKDRKLTQKTKKREKGHRTRTPLIDSPPAPRTRAPPPPEKKKKKGTKSRSIDITLQTPTRKRGVSAGLVAEPPGRRKMPLAPHELDEETKGKSLWGKLMALDPNYYEGKESEFKGAFGRWMVELLQRELFQLTARQLLTNPSDQQAPSAPAVSSSYRTLGQLGESVPRSLNDFAVGTISESSLLDSQSMLSLDAQESSGTEGDIAPPLRVLISLKAEIEKESRRRDRDPDPERIAELSAHLATLSEDLTALGSIELGRERPALSHSSELPEFSYRTGGYQSPRGSSFDIPGIAYISYHQCFLQQSLISERLNLK